jgi:sulfonate transport system substrate-binding protein
MDAKAGLICFSRRVHEASDRATRYGILTKALDVDKAVDRSFTAVANSN